MQSTFDTRESGVSLFLVGLGILHNERLCIQPLILFPDSSYLRQFKVDILLVLFCRCSIHIPRKRYIGDMGEFRNYATKNVLGWNPSRVGHAVGGTEQSKGWTAAMRRHGMSFY